jgi:hypothetical protein
MTIIGRTFFGLTATLALAAPAYANNTSSLSQIANFHQPNSSSTVRPLYYKNEDVVSGGTVTPKARLYTTNGTSTAPATTAVKFSFLDSLTGYSRSLAGELDAAFSLSAVSTSAVQSLGGYFFQNFESGTISYKLTTPVYKLDALGKATGPALTNLLTVTFQDALLSGASGSTAFLFSASTAESPLSFTSDFLNFSDVPDMQAFDFSIAGTASTPSLARAGTNRSLRNFRAVSVGQFSASPAPEPVTWGMMLAGFGLVGGTMRARRRKDALLAA